MRNIVDLEMDELLSEGPSGILEAPLLEGEDLTDLSLALLDSAGNTPAEPLSSQ
jgi:hypothetical protein